MDHTDISAVLAIPRQRALEYDRAWVWRYLVILGGCGRVSFDPICVINDAVVVTHRSEHWQDGVVGSTIGNPTSAIGGIAWSYEWNSGDALGTAHPWYREAGMRLVWDDDWFQQGGRWTYSDDILPLVGPMEMTEYIDWDRSGLIRLLNVAETAVQVRGLGQLTLRWRGYVDTTPVAVPVDVDVAIVALDGASEQTVLAATFPKPTADASFEDLVVPVPIRAVVIAPGDSLVITMRPTLSNPAANAWVSLDDTGLGIELATCE